MRLALVLALASCAVAPASIPANHPASASAAVGRLAAPPETLRPGTVKYDAPAPVPAEPRHHGS